MKYDKKQIGWIFLLIMIAIGLIFFIIFENNIINVVTLLIVEISCIIASLLFFQLKITFSGNTLILIYGIGLIKIKKDLSNLQNVEVITTPWYYGMLIRITSEGMLYNIQGRKAVRITLVNSGNRNSFMVGTQEPEKLKKILDAEIKK